MTESILTKQALWEALGAEIAKPRYSALPDVEIMAALNAPVETLVPASVPVSRLTEALLEREKWGVLQKARALVSKAGDAATALYGLLNAPRADDIMVDAAAATGELKSMVAALVLGGVLDADDVTALRQACRVAQAGPSIGRLLAIGEVCLTHIYQARNNGDVPPWKGPGGIKSVGAAAITDASSVFLTDKETASGAYEWSAEIDGGASTIIGEVTVFVTIADWASAPTGYVKLMALPFYATGGTAFDSAPPGPAFAVSADAQYDFFAGVHLPPCQYFQLGLYNGTNVAIDTDDLDAWYWLEKITV